MSNNLDKYFNVRIKLQNDSKQNWEKNDFIPLDGEIIIYDIDKKDADSYFQLIKIGNGINKLSELPFINKIGKGQIYDTSNPENDYGTISINDKNVKILGLQDMAYQLKDNYYTKEEHDIYVKERVEDAYGKIDTTITPENASGILNTIAFTGDVSDLKQEYSSHYLILDSNFNYN